MNNNDLTIQNTRKNTLSDTLNLGLRPISEKINLNSCRKIPTSNLVNLGVLSPELAKCIKPKEVMHLYRAVDNNGKDAILNVSSKALDGAKRAIVRNSNGIASQANLVKVDIPTTPPFDPVTLSIAVALHNISKQLDEIKDLQNEMLDFIKKDKTSKQKGDYNYIQGLIDEYVLNHDNKMFVQTASIKVEDIKQNAHHNIEFYEDMITALIKKGFNIVNAEIYSTESKLSNNFKNYQLAIHLFCMSSFFTMILNKNTKEEYLNNIISTIKTYSSRYKELYTICYNHIEKSLSDSFQTKIANALKSGVNKINIPKLNTPKFDTELKYNLKLTQNKDDVCYPFLSTFETVREMQNKQVEAFINDEYTYLKY